MSYLRRWLVSALLSVAACQGQNASHVATQPVSAVPIGTAECAACGMVVAEQPAPRAQLIHRDGKRVFFCSLGDLAHYLHSPSPHGPPQATFVEVVEPHEVPSEISSQPRPWLEAERAAYVHGVSRPMVMGPGLSAYASSDAAQAALRQHGGRELDWPALRALVTQE